MRSRVLRLSAASLLLGAAVATMAPHLTSYISSSAVVNAPLLAVRAPFAGILAKGSPGFATSVRPGQLLLQLDGEREDQDALSAVRAETQAARAEIAALVAQIATMTDLQTDLHARISAHDQAAGLYLAAERQRLQATLARAEARHDQADAERDRVARLAGTGAIPQATLERAEAERRMTRLEAEEVGAMIQALDVEARSLAQGIAIDGTANGGAYARQRLDEVALQIAELTSRRATIQGRLAALELQDSAVGADFARRTTFRPEAAMAAVVWRAAPPGGTSVMAGDTLMELLDCQNRFVEVALPGRLFESVRPGDPATVRLKGAAGSIVAHVEAVGGAGARFDHPNLASNPAEIADGDIQVLVRLDPVDPSQPEIAASFCDVGRTAEVRFKRNGPSALDRLVAAAGALGGQGHGPSSETQPRPGRDDLGAS